QVGGYTFSTATGTGDVESLLRDLINLAVEQTQFLETVADSSKSSGAGKTGEKRKTEETSFRDQLRETTRQGDGLSQSLLPIPGSLSALIKQSLQAVSPEHGVMSTLAKSFQLVLMEVGGAFAPAILKASQMLQWFAEVVKKVFDGLGRIYYQIIGQFEE